MFLLLACGDKDSGSIGESDTSSTGAATSPATASAGSDPDASATSSPGSDPDASATSSATSGPDTSATDTTWDNMTGGVTTETECQDKYFTTFACKAYPEDCPAPPPWRPFLCGGVVCGEGEVCVADAKSECCEFGQFLSSTGDTSTGSTTDSETDATTGPDPWVSECVGFALCGFSLFPQYSDGYLDCPLNHDCY